MSTRTVSWVLSAAFLVVWPVLALAQEEPPPEGEVDLEPPPDEEPPASPAPFEDNPAEAPEEAEPVAAAPAPVDYPEPEPGDLPVPTPQPAPPTDSGVGEDDSAGPVEPSEERIVTQEASTGPRLQHGFGFGSYGRVGAGTDLRGSTARPLSVVQHAPRIVESPYMELDLYYDMTSDDAWAIRTQATLAFLEDLFHYSGDFSSMLAIRNAYVAFTWNDMLEVWAGSRMYRGDDIYLLDYWPLDNLNTLGGGVGYRRDRFEIRAHAGVNRLADEFQFQEVLVPGRLFGAEEVVYMDRQRLIASVGASYRLLGPAGGPALKLKGYLELHYLAAGTLREEDLTIETLPSDFGWVGGVQLGSWGFGERLSHVSLFLRFGQGLAAFNEMAIPFGVDATKRSFPGASELVIGLSANYERGRFGLQGAGYLRRFSDADSNRYDPDDGWELVVDVRPYVVIWGPLQAAVDISYQQAFPTGLSPSALEVLNPSIFQIAPMLVFAPLGPGSYSRPHIRLVYRLAYLNDGALDLYAFEDPRRADELVHYLGVQVEWWFNSSYR